MWVASAFATLILRPLGCATRLFRESSPPSIFLSLDASLVLVRGPLRHREKRFTTIDKN